MKVSVIERRISAGNQFDGSAGAAIGTITAVAGSALVFGEEFYLDDGKGPEVAFRFVTEFFEPTPTLRPVVFDAADTVLAVRDKIIIAINAAKSINIIASIGSPTQVALKNRLGGSFGNVTPTVDTVSDVGFVVSAMAGGVTHGFSDIDGVRIYDERADGGQFDFPNLVPQALDGIVVGGSLITVVEQIHLGVLTATSYTVQAVAPDERIVVLSTGAPPASGNAILGPFTIGGEDRLQVLTAGATGALLARVIAVPLGKM